MWRWMGQHGLVSWAPDDETGAAAGDLDDLDQEIPELPAGDVFNREYVEKLRGEAAKYRTRYKETRTQFAEPWGADPEVLANARALYEASTTPEGLSRIFVEAGTIVGVPPAELQRLIDGMGKTPKQEPPKPPVEDLATPVTWDKLAPWMQEQFAQAVAPVQQSIAAARQEQQAAQALGALETALERNKITDATERRIVLELAQAHVSSDENDPRKLAAAVDMGVRDYQAVLERSSATRLADKAKANGSLPRPLSGGTPAGDSTLPAVKTMKEAHARLRQRMEAAGEE